MQPDKLTEFSVGAGPQETHLIDFFRGVFSTSEGAEEGARIAAFVQNLLATPDADLLVCKAHRGDALLGAVAFSRMSYAQDARDVFILSPMAVATDRQRSGIGQALIRFGLQHLRDAGVNVVLTYGDPAYYRKTGFAPIAQEVAQPPQKLSYPHGWLGHSLDRGVFMPLTGPSRSVAALDDPALW